jgi:hypothetical protein
VPVGALFLPRRRLQAQAPQDKGRLRHDVLALSEGLIRVSVAEI